jgi:hypothetical protein
MRLRKAVELYDTLMSTVTGCSDGGCMIRAPKGMHTNGGCRCHRDSMKTQRVLYSAKQLRQAIDMDAIAARIATLEQTLREIANADTVEWDDPTEFEAWAKSRARWTLAKGGEA